MIKTSTIVLNIKSFNTNQSEILNIDEIFCHDLGNYNEVLSFLEKQTATVSNETLHKILAFASSYKP